MQTVIFILSAICGLLLSWIVFLYAVVIPNIKSRHNRRVAYLIGQVEYNKELSEKTFIHNCYLQKKIDEYIKLEQKKSIDEFNKKNNKK